MNVKFLVLSLATFLAIEAFAFQQNTQQAKVDSLDYRVQRMDDDLSRIRRDQLNYKIEKDLIKEVYSSNLNTINVVITIILAVFGVMGFLGIRDIGALKKEYSKELQTLNNLRQDFEAKFMKIQESQEKVKDSYAEIMKTNEEQNRRIKILELQDKILSLIKEHYWERALEYIKVTLDLEPENVTVLGFKAFCFFKLKDYENAIITYEKIQALEPDNIDWIMNLPELFLITEKFEKYEQFYMQHKLKLESYKDGLVMKYFNIFSLYLSKTTKQLSAAILETLKTFNIEKESRVDWNFDDVLIHLSSKRDSKKKEYFVAFINFLQGGKSISEAKEILDA